MAQQNKPEIGIAGQEVILKCRDIPHDKHVTWKYDKALIRSFEDDKHLRGKAPNSSPLLPSIWLRNLFPPNQAYFFKRQSCHDRSI